MMDVGSEGPIKHRRRRKIGWRKVLRPSTERSLNWKPQPLLCTRFPEEKWKMKAQVSGALRAVASQSLHHTAVTTAAAAAVCRSARGCGKLGGDHLVASG